MSNDLNNPGIRLLDPAQIVAQSKAVVTALNQTVGTIPAAVITGGSDVTMITTNATPGTQTTRTAAQLFADDTAASIGWGYVLTICNSGAGTLTLAGGTGVTISGTATVATNTSRFFTVVYGGTNAAPTVTITNTGVGTYT